MNYSKSIGPWLTAAVAAEYLGYPTVKALYQALRRLPIPRYKLGRKYRFVQAELDHFMRQQRLVNKYDLQD